MTRKLSCVVLRLKNAPGPSSLAIHTQKTGTRRNDMHTTQPNRQSVIEFLRTTAKYMDLPGDTLPQLLSEQDEPGLDLNCLVSRPLPVERHAASV
jgi:hypothetical protein